MPYAITISGDLVAISPGFPFQTVELKIADDEAEHYGVPAGSIVSCVVNHSARALETFSAEDLDRYQIVETPLSVSEARQQQLNAAAVQFGAHRQAPMAWDFGDIAAKDDAAADRGAAGFQTLQMRDAPGIDDLKNWLAAAQGAAAMIAAGAGASILPLKTSANVWVQTTAAEVLQVLVTGDGVQMSALARGQAMLVRYGALKAQINTAADAAAALAVDTSAGWPA